MQREPRARPHDELGEALAPAALVGMLDGAAPLRLIERAHEVES